MTQMPQERSFKAGSGRLTFRLVTAQAELYAIASDWHELVEASAAPASMQDPSWLLLWWRHYGAGVELAVGLLYDGEQLVGLAPMCIRQYVYRFGLVFRRLQFMGIDANEKDGVCSEYMSFIARRGHEDAVANAFVDHIFAGRFGAWHETVLSAMNEDSPIVSIVERHLAQRRIRYERKTIMSAYYIKLPRTWEAYLQSQSPTRRDRIENSMAKFEEWAGEKGWKLERANSPESLETGFSILRSLHEERWRSDGLDGAFASPRFVAFHRDYIASMIGSGLVDIAWLTVGGTPVAASYTIRNGGKVVAYQYGRAVGLPTPVRVGVVINSLLIQEAIARGDEEFDFPGGESRYKVDLASHTRALVQLRAARPSAREFIRLGMVNARDRFMAALKSREAPKQAKPSRDVPVDRPSTSHPGM